MDPPGAGMGGARQKGHFESPGKIDDSIRELIRSTPSCLFVLDWKLRIIYMNPAFQRLTGYRKAEAAQGQVVFSVHPDDREEAESSVIMALVGRTARCRCRVRGSDGCFHALELSFSPLPGADICRVLCVDAGRNT